jgi:hypothetical protein
MIDLASVQGRFGHGLQQAQMEDARRQEAEKEAAARRATDHQILEDAEQLVTAWNERQAKRMPMLLSPRIGAAIICTARKYRFWPSRPPAYSAGSSRYRTSLFRPARRPRPIGTLTRYHGGAWSLFAYS